MEDKELIKICKKVLRKRDKKKAKRKPVKRLAFENPATRGAFPIAGRSGFGTYGLPFGYTPPAGGTTIIARDLPLEVIRKPQVQFVGGLKPEETNQIELRKTDDELKAQGIMDFLQILKAQQEITAKEQSDSIKITKPSEKISDPSDIIFVEMEDNPDFTRQESVNRFFRKPSISAGGGTINKKKDEKLDMKISDMAKRVAVIEKDHSKMIGKEKEILQPIEIQPTEILQPQLDFALITERARERKERSQMAEDDYVIPPRDVLDIPPRLREVAERSRMRKEDFDII